MFVEVKTDGGKTVLVNLDQVSRIYENVIMIGSGDGTSTVPISAAEYNFILTKLLSARQVFRREDRETTQWKGVE